ncbi:MAG: hypothetical protein JW724_05920 [Candidatus Altiarchaeota archaeon]|nr:hypothetical protein [Candidatus Altiarchaeota archaeon]
MKTKTRILGLALFALFFSAVMQASAGCVDNKGVEHPYGYNTPSGYSYRGYDNSFLCKHDGTIIYGCYNCYIDTFNGITLKFNNIGLYTLSAKDRGLSITARTSKPSTISAGRWLCKPDGTWERADPGKCYLTKYTPNYENLLVGSIVSYNMGVNRVITGGKWLCALSGDHAEWKHWSTIGNKCTFNTGGYKFTYNSRETPYTFYGKKWICNGDGKWYRVSLPSGSTSIGFDCYDSFTCYWGIQTKTLYARNKNTGVTWYTDGKGWIRT